MTDDAEVPEPHLTPDPLALERQVCFALAVASRSVIGVYRPVLQELQLTHPQYLVMLALWERSPLTATELSDLLYLDLPTLSPLLKRLEALGHVERRRDARDARVVRVSLSPSGRELRTRALEVPRTVMERLDLHEEELIALHEVLAPLIARTRLASRSRDADSAS